MNSAERLPLAIADPLYSANTTGRRFARVHWLVTKRVYSVSYAGEPVFYVAACSLSNVTFVLDPRLRAMYETRPQRKTVHALVRGIITAHHADDVDGELVRCNPTRWRGFVRATDDRTVLSADVVVLHPDRRIEAVGLVVA